MPTYRCNTCDINYPPAEKNRLKDKCYKCGEDVSYFTNKEWDSDWRERSLPPEDQQSGSPHPAEDSALVIYRNDTDTVHVFEKDLRALGYNPESGDIVKLNGKFYELLGYSSIAKMWWVMPFDFADLSSEIGSLPDVTEGFTSDDIVVLDHEGKSVYWNPRFDPFNNPEAGAS